MNKKRVTLLKTKNLKKTYFLGDQQINAVDDISIEIKNGDFLSIIGKSGSGKSTLMHLIGLLDTPTSGQIYIKNENTVDLNEKKLAHLRNKEIGFIFQAFNLLRRTTAIENVMIPLKYSHVPRSNWYKIAKEKLEIVDLADRLNNKSNELSGGQKQRVAIARALVNDPSIILADEPTGNLDSKTGEDIINLFKKLNKQGKTIIIVTHDDDLADVTKRKIRIMDGKIVK